MFGLTRISGLPTSVRTFLGDDFFDDFDNIMLNALKKTDAPKSSVLSKWIPKTDVIESESDYTISVDLPGLTQDSINVEVNDGVLSIKGERNHEKEITKKNYHRFEKSYGEFSRSFTLPDTIDTNKIKAEFQNGVLSLTLPKLSACKKSAKKQIKID